LEVTGSYILVGTIPAIFGCAIASYVITSLADFPVEPLAIKGRDNSYFRLHKDLAQREIEVYKDR
jgi:hypothetical protein